MNALQRTGKFLVRHFGYAAVLRLSWVFGLIIVYLPLAVIRWMPGHSMLGNLFVEYSFFQALGLGLPLFLSVWALMLTTCLTLDAERAHERCWIDDPWDQPVPASRWVSIPTGHPLVVTLFTLLAVPAVVVVIATAGAPAQMLAAAAGILLGGLGAYLMVDLLVYLVRCDNAQFRVLPWFPFGGWVPPVHALGAPHRLLTRVVDRLATWLGFWPQIYAYRPKPFVHQQGLDVARDHQRLMKDSHLFGVWCFLAAAVAYAFVYWLLRPSGQSFRFDIASQPPAAFVFGLLLPVIFLLAPFWNALRRYRLALPVTVAVSFVLYMIGGAVDLEGGRTGPAHTFDVFPVAEPPLTAAESLGVAPPDDSTLVVVAASGGGILATGWTATVLTELHRAYPSFRKDLRLISAVSGGSVAVAHYVSALDGTAAPLSDPALDRVVGDSLKSSLAVSAYGFAFPDFRRAVIPIAVNEEFDRGRLLEEDWRRTATAGRTRAFPTLLSRWGAEIRNGTMPAVIFNTTVMETGERVAITPIASLATDWSGLQGLEPRRRIFARTLSEFLGKEHAYATDVWTAARLSATFSYVSPAARAAIATVGTDGTVASRQQPGAPAARQHFIDGGYHDNSGVASALDWLDVVRTPRRVALIEIRARPIDASDAPIGQWRSEWLGPFLGLLSAWGSAQSTVSDTAINRRIARSGSSFQSFVFVMYSDGPLSWHLSRQQQKTIWGAWCEPRNQAILKALLNFVQSKPATDRCPRGPNDSPPRFYAEVTAKMR
jgi:Patatin-like phospholipase